MDTTTPARPAQALRCYACGRRLRKPTRGVPRSDTVRCVDCADHELLSSYGIDPVAARAAYERERQRQRRCARCGGRPDDLVAEIDGGPDTDVDGDVVCAACRAGDVEQRGERPPARRARPAVVVVDETEAAQRAWAYGAFFLVGIAAFAHTLLGCGLVASTLLGAVAAVAGGRATWRAYTARDLSAADAGPRDRVRGRRARG